MDIRCIVSFHSKDPNFRYAKFVLENRFRNALNSITICRDVRCCLVFCLYVCLFVCCCVFFVVVVCFLILFYTGPCTAKRNCFGLEKRRQMFICYCQCTTASKPVSGVFSESSFHLDDRAFDMHPSASFFQ